MRKIHRKNTIQYFIVSDTKTYIEFKKFIKNRSGPRKRVLHDSQSEDLELMHPRTKEEWRRYLEVRDFLIAEREEDNLRRPISI